MPDITTCDGCGAALGSILVPLGSAGKGYCSPECYVKNKGGRAEEHIPGMGCKCSAHDESECGCQDVDWRSAREVELEAMVEKLRAALAWDCEKCQQDNGAAKYAGHMNCHACKVEEALRETEATK